MIVRAAVTEEEYREATRLLQGRLYWLRLLTSNWYVLAIAIGIIFAVGSSFLHGRQLSTGGVVLLLAVAAFYFGHTVSYRGSRIASAAKAFSKTEGMLRLDERGLRRELPDGRNNLIPWAKYAGWIEGKWVAVLRQSKGAHLIPLPSDQRDAILALLECQLGKPTRHLK